MNAIRCHRIHRKVAGLATLAVNHQVPDASAFYQVIDLQLRGFFRAQALVQQNGQDCPIAQAF